MQGWWREAGAKPDPGEEPFPSPPPFPPALGQHHSPWGHRVGTPHRLGGQAVEVHGGHKGPRAARHGVPGPRLPGTSRSVPAEPPPRGVHSKVSTKGRGTHPEGGARPACLKNRPSLGQQTVAPQDSSGGASQRAPRKENETQASPHVTQLLTGHCRANKHEFKVVRVTVQRRAEKE